MKDIIANNIGVLIVTYNRLNLLKKVLTSYEQGKVLPKYIMVLDNASDKDTALFLANWKKIKQGYAKYVVRLEKNEGSSKGFSTALLECVKLNCDWIFVVDDDAFPTKDTISQLYSFIENHRCNDFAAVCAKVINFGAIDIVHRRRTIKRGLDVKSVPVNLREYEKNQFELDEFSYVGTAINREAIKKLGSTKDDLYIFYDDTEHSLRLRKYGKIICVPQIEIIHNKKPKTVKVDFQTFYYIRNRGWMIKKYFGNKYARYFAGKIYIKNVFFISAILKRYSPKERQLYKDALYALKNDNMGIDSRYLPGWSR